jgi:hypothetical protein
MKITAPQHFDEDDLAASASDTSPGDSEGASPDRQQWQNGLPSC